MAKSIIASRKHARGMAIAAAGIAYHLRAISGVLFVLLRHTAESWMVMRGAGVRDVLEILGHADYKMTQRYAHLSPAHLRVAVGRRDGLTAGTLRGATYITAGGKNSAKFRNQAGESLLDPLCDRGAHCRHGVGAGLPCHGE
jgi:integrase-like protein